jgi:predicted transcriptional regulator
VSKKQAPLKGTNLKYLIGKLKPVAARVAELERELEPLQEQRQRLARAAKAAAREMWDEAVERAATEWKSTRGEDELSIEWADSKYGQIPAEVFEYVNLSVSNYGRPAEEIETDLLAFHNAVREEIEGEDD